MPNRPLPRQAVAPFMAEMVKLAGDGAGTCEN